MQVKPGMQEKPLVFGGNNRRRSVSRDFFCADPGVFNGLERTVVEQVFNMPVHHERRGWRWHPTQQYAQADR